MLGAQRVDVGAICAIWTIQDRIALTTDEEKSIELKRDFMGGQEHVVWNPSLSLPLRDYEFTDAEVGRIRSALQTWDSNAVAGDRHWLEPIVQALYVMPDVGAPREDLS